jgi:hypothetical protein
LGLPTPVHVVRVAAVGLHLVLMHVIPTGVMPIPTQVPKTGFPAIDLDRPAASTKPPDIIHTPAETNTAPVVRTVLGRLVDRISVRPRSGDGLGRWCEGCETKDRKQSYNELLQGSPLVV